MENKSSFKPVSKTERIEVLDALRGFAIFGILVINIRVFSGYAYMSEDAKSGLALAEWNSTFDWLHSVFFSGKFYTLFSLLFGIGFAIQFMRASKSNRSFSRHFVRRLFFLLHIGIVHLWGIWFSDILVIYALCGYALIPFNKCSNRGMVWAAFIMMLIPGLHSWYLQTADNSYTNIIYEKLNENWAVLDLPNAADEYEAFRMVDVVEVIQSDSWSTVLSFNYIGPLLRAYITVLDVRLFKVLAMFILGLWAGRQILSNNLHKNRSRLLGFAIAGIVIGLPLNLLYAADSPFDAKGVWILILKEAVTPFGYVSLTTGYVAIFMLLYHTPLKKLLEKCLRDVGKTALSNYILQSLICIFVFYEIGFGLGKYLGSAYLTFTVFIIFSFQIVLSILWLKRYKYGPLEWLWRVLTYGSYMRNRQ